MLAAARIRDGTPSGHAQVHARTAGRCRGKGGARDESAKMVIWYQAAVRKRQGGSTDLE